jgi:hypothetical protein
MTDREPMLDNQPLVIEMANWCAVNHVKMLAQLSGVSARTLQRHMYGTTSQIRQHNATQIARAMGTPLGLLYPEMTRDISADLRG